MESSHSRLKPICVGLALALALGMALSGVHTGDDSSSAPIASFIVQAGNLEASRGSIERVGGEVTHELGIIAGVAARLTTEQVEELRRTAAGVRITANHGVDVAAKGGNGKNSRTTDDSLIDSGSGDDSSTSDNGGNGNGNSGANTPETYYPSLVRADLLHASEVLGENVTIAFVDTGIFNLTGVVVDSDGYQRILPVYNAMDDVLEYWQPSDPNGHGTHVSSVAASSTVAGGKKGSKFHGLAPDAQLLPVKAFDNTGSGTYADIIRGIDWVVSNRDHYSIRVLNLSFSATPQSYYWDDPLSQAVMRAWQAGIVVVASAGNGGPSAMTVGVPGNVPYVITVGGMTDSYTPSDVSDDRLTYFSAAGPTAAGFVKPDLVAPGGHMLGLMDFFSELAQAHPDYQAAACTSRCREPRRRRPW